MKKSATIKDIAGKLGLSASTVSRALSGMPGVDPMTREAVQDLANQLDYRPNLTAVRQVRKRSHVIGVVIPSFTIYFYAEALSGMDQAAKRHGYNLMVCQSSESYDQEKTSIDLLLSSKMDGLIMSISRETSDFEHIDRVLQRGMPVVLFNRVCNVVASKVTVDDYNSARQATQHLIDQGSRRIAHISGPINLEISQRRLAGYKDALTASGLAIDESLISTSDFTSESGFESAVRLLSSGSRPEAIFCVCDAVAYGVMEFARQNHIEVPDQLKIVGFTDEPESARTRPQLTTVHQPIFQIGEETVEVLVAQLNDPALSPLTRVVDSELRVRESSAP
ncbi:MAG: LacI family DNA-binding transcriptional regulator [Bacteroidota bacterium]